jgi:hypothetical protein
MNLIWPQPPRPLLAEPKEGYLPSPNLSPHGERLKKKIAETDDFL